MSTLDAVLSQLLHLRGTKLTGRLWRHIALGSLLCVACLLGYVLVKGRTWTSTASFSPSQKSVVPSALLGLAAQVGLSSAAGLGGSSLSPGFFVEVALSREVLEAVVAEPISFTKNDKLVQDTLLTFLMPREKDRAIQVHKAVEKLRKKLRVNANTKTSVISVAYSATNPEVAREVVGALVKHILLFNQESRQMQASDERRYIEQRIVEVRDSLNVAESRFGSFLTTNKDYRNSPRLTAEYDRLLADLSLKRQLYATLAASLEQARLDELRDTPTIVQIDRPNLPARPDRRNIVVKIVVALIFGSLLGLAYGLNQLPRR